MNRTSLLNFFIDRYQYNSYLEIGVGIDADNFKNINLHDKIGVDPHSPEASIKLSSDKFFEINNRKFDLIFIDGFHSRDQAYRDFENSYLSLNPGGCIVLHDCLPNEEIEQGPPRPGIWTGDVWKAFVRIRQLEFVESFTLDSDWGLGIVFNIPNTQVLAKSQVPILNWEAYTKGRDFLLRVIKLDELIKFLPEPTNKKRIKSTTIAEWGRIGHQFHDILSGMIISELFGFEHYYTGFHGGHCHINEYLNFGDFLPGTSDHNCTVEISTLNNAAKWEGMSIEFMRQHLRQIPPDTNVVFRYSTYYNILALLNAEKHQLIPLGLHNRILNKLRNIMLNTKLYSEFKSDFDNNDGKISVAMYVRAGGKLNDNAGYEQYRDEYDLVLDRVRKDYPDKELDIRVYSQGPIEDIKDFHDFKIIICEEEYPRLYEVMKTLITADVFIAGHSSFSSFISIFRNNPTYWYHNNRFKLSFDIIV